MEAQPKIQCSHLLKESILSLLHKQKIKRTQLSSREDHSDWFDDVEAKYSTKEDYMKSLAKSRTTNYYQKASRELKSSPCYENSTANSIINGMLDDFLLLLNYIDWFKEYFNRSCVTRYESTDNDETDGPPKKRQRISPTKKIQLRNVVDKSNIVTKYEKRLCNEFGEFRCRGRYSQVGCKFKHIINPYESNEKLKTFRVWQLDHSTEFTEIISKIESDVMNSINKSKKCVEHGETATRLPIMKYFQELFTLDNIRLVHIACHDIKANGIPPSADILCEKCDEFIKTNKLLKELKSEAAGPSGSKD